MAVHDSIPRAQALPTSSPSASASPSVSERSSQPCPGDYVTAAREQLRQLRAALAAAEARASALQQQLARRRGRDGLTSLISGRHFHAQLELEMQRARRYGDELGLLLIDIDHFRLCNERFGRSGGDKALARLGRLLREELRQVDLAFRYGGEEFAVILPRCGGAALPRLAQRLRRRIAATELIIDGQPVRLTVSIGAAVHRQGLAAERFIREADRALCRAKALGRNRVVVAGVELRSAAPASSGRTHGLLRF